MSARRYAVAPRLRPVARPVGVPRARRARSRRQASAVESFTPLVRVLQRRIPASAAGERAAHCEYRPAYGPAPKSGVATPPVPEWDSHAPFQTQEELPWI